MKDLAPAAEYLLTERSSQLENPWKTPGPAVDRRRRRWCVSVDWHRAAVPGFSGGRRVRRSAARRFEPDGIAFTRQNGVVRSAIAFEIYARRHPKRRLQAGEYFFHQPISGHDVFWQIADGHIYEQPFTVREGETIFDIARNLEAGKFMGAGEFLSAAKNPNWFTILLRTPKPWKDFCTRPRIICRDVRRPTS